ncbi:hypothetical protein AB0D32_03145 [Micromonospora sp. NPDC048170]|uniref:hypothetical protein n=1 Tax=Micromonospora sp. NPDC048170 TaxID=3154819 RepID=UPI0033CFD284
MKLRAAIVLALITLSLGVVVLGSPVEPAWACSCAFGPAEQDERADVIVVGAVTEVTDSAVRLAVESVEKGSVGREATLRLRVSRVEESCGYAFQTGTRYRVNSINGTTGLCTGVRELPATASAPAAAPTLVTAAPEPARVPGWWLVASATLTVLVAGLVAAALRRRRAG